MATEPHPRFTKRYKTVTDQKAGGATYTPKRLSDFVASQIAAVATNLNTKSPLRILDPAVGDGALLISLLQKLKERHETARLEVYGFETNPKALDAAASRLRKLFPGTPIHLAHGNFLEFALEISGGRQIRLFQSELPPAYDLIIANPPYVRTQIMGAPQAQLLARQFGLSGRVDLYYAFILGMAQVLKPQGIAGIIVSNRFMTTKSGAAVRRAVRQQFNISHVWDLGDTKVFEAAVLPAVLLVEGKNDHSTKEPRFTSIYETTTQPDYEASDPIAALSRKGIVAIEDGRRFQVQHGKLETRGPLGSVWRITTKAGAAWLATVEAHTCGTFRDIGKVRVGVKTCADRVFIRSDWLDMPKRQRPELLRAVTTHHIARRFRPLSPKTRRLILYPHEVVHGRRRPVDLSQFPRAKAYLEEHRSTLQARKYVTDSGRRWYEIWVPQDPAAWDASKLVFRDIAEHPTFWVDQVGSVVNGDCYWITSDRPDQSDLLWLAAAVGNSSFIEVFYDRCFNNKLYAGRRRFITQYVEKFPLPDPESQVTRAIIAKAKQIYDQIHKPETQVLQSDLDALVWQAFGLSLKEVVW